MAISDILGMEFQATGTRGNTKECSHTYILRCNPNATEAEVWDWLNQTQAESATAIPVDRPDGGTSDTGYPILDAYENLILDDISYNLQRDRDPQVYRVVATYRNTSNSSGGGGPRQDTAAVATFRLGLEYAPENITYRTSLETVTTYDQKFGTTSITAPDMNHAVNVQADGTIQGTQVPDPGLIETLSFTGFPGFFTTARRLLIANSRGKVNSANFTKSGVTYPAGTVRFLGASGNIATTGESTVDFRFGIRENVTGLAISGLDLDAGGVDYDGWDYFWVYYGKGVDAAGKPTTKPRGGYVERLFFRMDLNTLFT